MKNRKPTQQRKKEALEAAQKIIYQKGFSKLTIRGIAKELGISEAALYRHFNNKKDIIDKLTDLVFNKECSLKKDTEAEALVILNNFIIKQAEKFEENPYLAVISFQDEMFREYPEIKEKFNKHQKEREEEIIKIIEKGKSSNNIKQEINPASFAVIFMGSIRVSVLKWKNNNFSYSLKNELIKIKEELFKYIAGDKKW